jgi:hypothetical protein
VKTSLIGEMKKAGPGANTDLIMNFNFKLKREAPRLAAAE